MTKSDLESKTKLSRAELERFSKEWGVSKSQVKFIHGLAKGYAITMGFKRVFEQAEKEASQFLDEKEDK